MKYTLTRKEEASINTEVQVLRMVRFSQCELSVTNFFKEEPFPLYINLVLPGIQ